MIGNVLKVWIGFAQDQQVRCNAASGGIVTGSLIGLLENGAIDGAVVNIPDLEFPPHGKSMLAKTKDEIMNSAKSIYCMTEIKRGLNAAKYDTSAKKIAVVGLPCQIADLRKMTLRDEALASKIVICFGIMCGHNMLPSATIKALKQSGIDIKDVQEIRYRGKGWYPFTYVVKLKNGGVRDFSWPDSPLQKAWDSMLDQPQRCLKCSDFAAESADIACCDAWLDEYRGNQKGYSIVLSHTKKGTDLVERLMQDKVLKLQADDASCIQRSQYIQLGRKVARKKLEATKLRILFCGAGYGAGNIGDDAILAGLLKVSRLHLPKSTQYGAVTFNRAYTKRLAGVDQVFFFKDCVETAFEWATHVVLGGATLLSGGAIENCSNLINVAQLMGKPVCMLAAGTSNEPSGSLKKLLQDDYNKMSMITLRSEKDRQAAVKFGLLSKKLHVCADGAFAVGCNNLVYNPSATLGINLVGENDGDQKLSDKYPYVETITQLLTSMPATASFKFVCGETRKEKRYDYALLHDLHQRFGGQFFCDCCHYLDLFKVLISCKVVLSMRMHITLFCALLGVPCIPLVRESKMQIMADEVGFRYTVSLDESFPNLKRLVSEVLKDPTVALADADKVNALKVRALNNGAMLQEWMYKTL